MRVNPCLLSEDAGVNQVVWGLGEKGAGFCSFAVVLFWVVVGTCCQFETFVCSIFLRVCLVVEVVWVFFQIPSSSATLFSLQTAVANAMGNGRK